MPTRIVLDARMFVASPHGIARYAYSLAVGVARLRPDWEIGVWTGNPTLWNRACRELPNLTPVYEDAKPFSLKEQWRLPISASKFKADLVHFCSIAVPWFLPPRSVVTIHDLIPYHFPSFPFHRLVLKVLTFPILRRAQRLVCVSDFTSNDVQRWLKIGSERLRVIYNGGLDLEMLKSEDIPLSSPPQQVRPYFLCVSNPKPHKNVRVLLEAFKPLAKNHDLILVCSSSPWLERELAGRSAILRRSKLSDAEITQLYRGALAVVVPSLYEGFGIPALEALQLGAPLVSSNAASLPEVVGKAGLLFDPQDGADLTACLSRIACDATLRNELRKLGHDQSLKFSWKNCACEHVKLYEEMLA